MHQHNKETDMGLTRINNQALTDVTSAGLPSGSVLQVVYNEESSSVTGSSGNTYTTVASVSITPISTSSKILINFQSVYSANSNAHFLGRILRGSTVIGNHTWYDSSASMWAQYPTGSTPDSSASYDINLMYLDSPSTTSSTTYNVQFTPNNAVSWVVGSRHDSNLGYYPRISLMEIAG